MMKRVVIAVVVVVLAFSGYRIMQRINSKGSQRQQRAAAVPVTITPISIQAIERQTDFSGTLEASSRFEVAPKVSGRLEKLLVDIGDQVTKGELIAVLESEEYQQQVEQARAELEVAKAGIAETSSTMVAATREYERAKQLRAQKIAAIAEVDQAEATFNAATARHQVALAQIKQREAALRAAEVRLAYTTITASWSDGDAQRIVAERFVYEGAMLRANDPLISLVETSQLKGIIYVVERDFPYVAIGQEALVQTDAYPGRSFKGTVTRRAPVLREESRQARVEIEIPNEDQALAPGMFVRITIKMEQHAAVKVVPIDAVVRRNGQRGVFLANLEQRTATFVPVELGITTATLAEIIAPDLSGSVVTLGHHLLEDGAAIVIAAPDSPDQGSPEAKPEGSRS